MKVYKVQIVIITYFLHTDGEPLFESYVNLVVDGSCDLFTMLCLLYYICMASLSRSCIHS